MLNRVEHEVAARGGRQADPEALAGRALRRLRLARNWSQEEVAVRMTAYGYDFHQTTIAKIESAQRPLRVRELADFAALYGLELQELVYAPTSSLPEIDQEIVDVTARLEAARTAAAKSGNDLDSARMAMRTAESAHQASTAEVAVLEGRLSSLMADREKLLSWRSGGQSAFAIGSDEAEYKVSEPAAASIASIAESGPEILRIVLGTQLRRLREASGITAERAGYEIRASRSKISRLEAGRVGIKQRDVGDLLNLYGVTDKTQHRELLELARKSNTPSWWHVYSNILPDWFEAYIGLEMAANEIRVYEAQYVPDLLRTKDYSHSITSPDFERLSPKEIERRFEFLAARQARFLDRSKPSNLRVVLDEAVLRRQIGGPAVLRDQIEFLVEIAERPNITVQVLPLETSSDAAESFRILQFPELDLPAVVYMEQLASAIYLDTHEAVGNYQRVLRRLSAQALTPGQTTLFLRKLIALWPAWEVE